jgi:endonuclease/exonuclease/phosphatase family metal-dependent hydrolase
MNEKRPPRHKPLVVGDFFKPSYRTASQKAGWRGQAAKTGQDAAAAAAKKWQSNRPKLTSGISSRGVLLGGAAM